MINFEETKTLAEFIENVARTYGDKTALKFRPKFRAVTFTYDEVYQLAKAVAVALKKAGVEKGDRVIIWAYNSPYWVAGFFGVQLTGAVAVPLNIQSKGPFIKKIVEITEAKFILKSTLLTIPEGFPKEFLDLETLDLNAKVDLSPIEINEDNVAEIVYTSGTTGFPKGVMLTHKNILSNLKGALSVINLTSEDRGLSILPLSHMFEQVAGMLAPLAVGAQVTYATALNSINIQRNLVEDKITKMAAVPEFLKLFIRRSEEKAVEEGRGSLLKTLFAIGDKTPFMNLRRILFYSILKRLGGHLDTIISGGAPLEEEVGKKWEAMGIYILQGYGTTEASPVISANSHQDRKISSVGKPLSDVEVKINPDGEILARGENIFKGYYKDTEKTKEALEDGWYKTGDLGYFDKDGHLHIHGRKKYMVVTEAGENVYPEDIEFELNKFPEVEDSCVVGLATKGKLIIHVVILGKGIKDPANIIAKVNQSLENYQQIQDFSLWPFDDFPRTVTKKVRREKVIKYLKTKRIEESEIVPVSAGLVEKAIVKITGNPLSEITPDKKLVQDLKMDSLERVELIALIEEETGIVLDEAEIGPSTRVSDIKQKVEHGEQKREKYRFKEWPISAWAILLRKIFQNLIIFPLANYFVKMKALGSENLTDLPLPALFYPNHISALDPVIVVKILPPNIKERLAIAAASDVIFEHPNHRKYEGILTFIFNIFPFSRVGQIKSSLEYTGRLLDRGFSILAFPEGRVSTDGKMQSLKEGAGFLAVEMETPIVPIKIDGTQNIVSPGTELPCWPKKGKVTVKIGKPLSFPPGSSYLEATEKIEKAMRSL